MGFGERDGEGNRIYVGMKVERGLLEMKGGNEGGRDWGGLIIEFMKMF